MVDPWFQRSYHPPYLLPIVPSSTSASAAPTPPQSYPGTPLIAPTTSNLNTPSPFSSFRGRGSFRGNGGRGRGGGKFTPPPPMPFFINPGAEKSFRRRDVEDENVMGSPVADNSGASGSQTPHYGIGAASTKGTPAGPKSSFGSSRGNSRGGRDRGRGGGFGSGNNPMLKPITFVKAGTLFQEGEVEVLVKDQDFSSSGALRQDCSVTLSNLRLGSITDVSRLFLVFRAPRHRRISGQNPH